MGSTTTADVPRAVGTTAATTAADAPSPLNTDASSAIAAAPSAATPSTAVEATPDTAPTADAETGAEADETTAADDGPPPPPAQSLGTPWSGPGHPLILSWWRRWVMPVALVLLLTGWVVLREVDRLIGGLVSTTGAHESLAAVTGMFAIHHEEAWGSWRRAGFGDEIQTLVGVYVAGDTLFIVAYAFVLWLLTAWSRSAVAFLVIAVIADLDEGLLLLEAASRIGSGQLLGELPTAIVVASTTKWVALGLMVVAALVVRASRRSLWGRLIRLVIALWVHRMAVLFVAGFGVVALSPTSGIFDQLPDVQRDWFGVGRLDNAATVAGQALLSFALLTVAACVFWGFGRRRTKDAFPRLLPDDDAPLVQASGTITWWVAAPYACLAIAVLSTYAGSGWLVLLIMAALTTALIVAGALAAQWAWAHSGVAARLGGTLIALAAGALLLRWADLGGASRWTDPTYIVVVFVISIVVIGASAILRAAVTNEAINAPAAPVIEMPGVLSFVDSGSRSPEWPASTPSTEWSSPAATESALESYWSAAPDVPPAAPAPDITDAATPPIPRDEAVRSTWLIGDGLATFALALAPLGLVRSLTGAAMADAVAEESSGVPLVWIWLAIALVGCVGVPLLASTVQWGIDRRLAVALRYVVKLWRALFDPRCLVPPALDSWVVGVDVLSVGLGALGIALGTFFPLWFAGAGPVAVTVILLLSWSLLLGGVILAMQRRRPLALFTQLGMSATPVILIVTLYMFLISAFAASPQAHAVRAEGTLVPGADTAGAVSSAGAAVPVAPRDSADRRFTTALEARFAEWLGTAQPCAAPGGVAPLVLVAAEGGGGRAAYWTVQAMTKLREGAGCLGSGLFAASGVSGGSVGLAVDQVVRTVGRPTEAEQPDRSDRPRGSARTEEGIVALTGAEPLARVVTGFLAGDYVAAISGVRVPSAGGEWLDRAGHLETAWESEVDDLAQSFDLTAPPEQPFLILNSADSVSGCRVTVTQLPILAGTAWSGEDRLTGADCGSPDTGAGFAIEFDEVWPGCSQNLPWSTAAMLSARFPFVTPGGRMPAGVAGGCAGADDRDSDDRIPEAQLVDGGYAEGTGLAALADIMPEVVRLATRHNVCVSVTAPAPVGPSTAQSPVEGGGGAQYPVEAAEPTSEGETLENDCGAEPRLDVAVLPIVVYIKNERGFEVDPEVERLAAEFLVPLAGAKAKGLQNSEEAWLQRLTDQLAEFPRAAGCEATATCDRGVVVVSSATTPTLAAPLGWTLSELSRISLDEALARNVDTCGTVDGYPTLGDLIATFTAGSC